MMTNRGLLLLVILPVIVMWTTFISNMAFPFVDFNQFGIKPRTLEGLRGIITSPFLHANTFHLMSNTAAFIGTGLLVILSVGSATSFKVFVSILIMSGFGTWITASSGVVVGMSGVIYGFLAFLFAYAKFNPSIRTLGSALIAFFLYSGTIIGLFKFAPYISWAAHFWGFVSGIFTAYIILKREKPCDTLHSNHGAS